MDVKKANRFLSLARAGQSGAGSSGEIACYRLACALAEIGDDLMILDPDAIEGALSFALLMAGPFATEADKQRIYSFIEPFKIQP